MGVPSGQPVLPGFPSFSIVHNFPDAEMRSAWRECDRGNFCTKPLYSCGFSRTLSFVTMRPRTAQSQWENAHFPQFSWVFVPFSPKIADFSRFFAVPAPPAAFQPPRQSPVRAHSKLAYRSPNSTIFFGFSAAAIGVFKASTTGVASLK